MLCSLDKTVLNILKGLFILTSSKEGMCYDKGPKSFHSCKTESEQSVGDKWRHFKQCLL